MKGQRWEGSEGANALLWGVCAMCLCVCVRDASEWLAGCFLFTAPTQPPTPCSVTLYSDCLQARRHFPVKVSLMNSNDPTECLRQVIHNHSSFTFSLNPLSTPLLHPPPPNKTAFPRNYSNLLSVFIYFIFFCLIVHVVSQHWITSSWGWMPLELLMMKWATRSTISGNELQKTEPKVTDRPKVKAVFPINPLSQMPCPSFTTTNTSELHWSYSEGFQMKNVLDDTIDQHCSIKKKCIQRAFFFIVLVSIYIEFKGVEYTISQTDQFEPSPSSDHKPPTSVVLLINH